MSSERKQEEIMGVVVEPENMASAQDYFMDRYLDLDHPVILTEDVSTFAEGEFSLQDYDSFDSHVEEVDPELAVFGGRLEDIAYADERIEYSDFRIDIDSFRGEEILEMPSHMDILREWASDILPFYRAERPTVKSREVEEVLEEYGLQDRGLISLHDYLD